MRARLLNCGLVPLVDCAPLILARDLNFASEEGISLNLLRQPSWSALRDLLVLGHLDVAHMLSPMPIAMSMGLGGFPAAVDALMVLSVNGNVIGVSNKLAEGMRMQGWDGAFDTPELTRDALLAAAPRDLRIGIPFPYSMHAELLRYWLEREGDDPLNLCIVPPPRMTEAVAADEVDAFCVGEPWGSMAIESRSAELILPGAAIWQSAPEKVLGARHDWVVRHPETVGALLRAVYRATAWLGDHDNRPLALEILARPENLDLPDYVIDRALNGRLVTRPLGFGADVEGFLRFFHGSANFPWRSQAVWIAKNLAWRHGLDPVQAADTARGCFRADLYRATLAEIGVDLPGASEKLEGTIHQPIMVGSTGGRIKLAPDAFFDGKTFDPDQII